MTTTKTLNLVFLDEDGNEYNISLKSPKDNLKHGAVVTAMESIITNNAFVTDDGKALASASDCYYKTVTIDELSAEEGE